MDFWNYIFFTDITLFILVSMTVIYMGIFAVASLFSRTALPF